MTSTRVQLIREGKFAADVEFVLCETGSDWAPTIGLQDIQKLDRVRLALRAGDIAGAAREATVFRLVPQSAQVEQHVFGGFNESEQGTLE